MAPPRPGSVASRDPSPAAPASVPDPRGAHRGGALRQPAGSTFTGDFESLVAWLALRMDKTAIADLVRINWRTVGRIIERVVTDELDPGRLDGLFEIGVDEISWRKHHNYLTLVADHRSGKVVWGAEGRGLTDPRRVLRRARRGHDQPSSPRCRWTWDPRSPSRCAPTVTHRKRRSVWTPSMSWRWAPKPSTRCAGHCGNRCATCPILTTAKKFKGARWALLKNPDTLTDTQAATLAAIRRNGGAAVARLPAQGSTSGGLRW